MRGPGSCGIIRPHRIAKTGYPGGDAGQTGEQVNTTYNARGLPYSLAGSSTYVSSAAYNAPGQVDLRTLGNGRQVDYVYYPWTTPNGRGRVQQIKTGTSGSPTDLQYLEYTYDAVGNVKTIKDNKVLGGMQTQTFNYDALDRLLDATVTGGSAGQGQYSESYTYYPIGNILTKTGQGTYSYGSKPHTMTSTSGGGSFSYDGNGNMTSRTEGGVTYQQTFDAENRLQSVAANGQTTTFTYRCNGLSRGVQPRGG